MKRKLLIVTIILSIVLLLSGCIESDVPQDQPIILSKDNPSFDLVITSDTRMVTWTIDGKSRTDDLSGDANKAHYLLEFKNLSIGNHVLRAEDSDDIAEWQIQVIGTEEEQRQLVQLNQNKDDGHYPTWEEQIKAAEKNKK